METNLSDKIANVAKVWSRELEKGIKKDIEDVAKSGVEKLKTKSPKRTGKYSKSWRVRKNKTAYTLYNERYQLTHLLENGHLNKNGTRTKPIRHIAPVEEELINTISRMIEKRINGS